MSDSIPIPNPVLPGWHPDPSVCRVGDEYFLVTSSFAFYPGLPIHRSRDLRTWELVGHALIDDSWLPLGPVDVSDGIWAATIRYADGVFYIVFTVAGGRTGDGHYVITSTDPSGPWSTPHRLEGAGIDPSLFFDDDGRAFLAAARDSEAPGASGPGEIWLREFDPTTSELIGPTHILWHGALTGVWVEAPHIYKHDGVYHLIGAEGGTERNHSVTAARSAQVTGPYVTDPRSPLLTHRHLGEGAEVQNVGHADIFDAADGSSWAVLLGVRPIAGHHTLGRETFLVPVDWSSAGPVFAPGEGRVGVSPRLIEPAPTVHDWISLRGPVDAVFSEATISLASRPAPLDSSETPAFLGLRQTSHSMTFETTIDTADVREQEVGIVAMQGGSTRLLLRITRGEGGEGGEGGAIVSAVQELHSVATTLAQIAASGLVRLGIRATPGEYALVATVAAAEHVLARVSHTVLSTEVAGGFVGVTVGLFSIGEPDAGRTTFHDVTYR